VTKSDLAGAYAKIEWADRHIDMLVGEIEDFGKRDPFLLAGESHPEGTLYRFCVEEDIPASISVEIGMILAALRSSLDVLAVTLAARNGYPDSKTTYFPYAGNAESFGNRAFRRKIRDLSDPDQKSSTDLKTYPEGNATFAALHNLNLTDKHRGLVATGAFVGSSAIEGAGILQLIALYPGPYIHGSPVALWKVKGNLELRIAVGISFAEIPDLGRPPVIETLRSFRALAYSYVEMFG